MLWPAPWLSNVSLLYRVQNVTIGYPNEIRRMNNLEMVKRLKIPIERLHTLKINDYNKRILLDSQPLHLPCFEKVKFDVVIDHHPVTIDWDAKFIDIRPNYGATSSIMVEYLRAADIKPSISPCHRSFLRHQGRYPEF